MDASIEKKLYKKTKQGWVKTIETLDEVKRKIKISKVLNFGVTQHTTYNAAKI